jgi:hypothetical protein
MSCYDSLSTFGIGDRWQMVQRQGLSGVVSATAQASEAWAVADFISHDFEPAQIEFILYLIYKFDP